MTKTSYIYYEAEGYILFLLLTKSSSLKLPLQLCYK